MADQRSQFAMKFLPSLTDFAFLLPLAFLFGRMEGVQTLLSDCDTGWHIRTGDWMVANRLIPTHDVFSFSKPNGVWFAWEWLSDLLFAGLNHVGGLRAVVLLTLVLLCAVFTLLFRMAKRHANPLVAIGVTVLAVASSSVHWLARPHLFTLLFLLLFFLLLERVREGRPRIAGIPYFVLLPAATVLWTNLHGGFIIGILMVAIYGVGELLTAAFTADAALRRRVGLPGGQPGESLRMAPARSSFRVFARSVRFAAHLGVLQSELPSPDGDILRSSPAVERRFGFLVWIAAPVHRIPAIAGVRSRGIVGRA